MKYYINAKSGELQEKFSLFQMNFESEKGVWENL